MYSGSFAFTLAETLITIGMIGVIAALTLPTLMNSTNDKEIVARVKKVNATLQEAYGRAYAKYGPVDTWFTNDGNDEAKIAERFGKRISEFLQVEKLCGYGTSASGCFSSDEVKNIWDGKELFDVHPNYYGYKMILSDGTAVAFTPLTVKNVKTGAIGYEVYFDIDGSKGKNVVGIDVFSIFLGYMPNYSADVVDCLMGQMQGPLLCAKWIFEYDNADYIHTTKGKCSNGTTLSNTNPTCN